MRYETEGYNPLDIADLAIVGYKRISNAITQFIARFARRVGPSEELPLRIILHDTFRVICYSDTGFCLDLWSTAYFRRMLKVYDANTAARVDVHVSAPVEDAPSGLGLIWAYYFVSCNCGQVPFGAHRFLRDLFLQATIYWLGNHSPTEWQTIPLQRSLLGG
jgi:hypothetical protein